MNQNKFKILTLIGAVFGILFAIYPQRLTVSAALAEPVGYEYKYKARSVSGYSVFLFETPGGIGYEPRYTRTVDSTYYNYTTVIDDLDYTPFPITLTFNRSNTPWYDTGSGYVPYDNTTIGSDGTVGTLNGKINFYFNNTTNHDYQIYLDRSSSGNAKPSYWKYESRNYGGQYEAITLGYATITENRIFVPAYTNWNIVLGSSSLQEKFDALYIDDLGVSDAWNNGFVNGEDEGFLAGFDVGASQGYDAGFLDGRDDGIAYYEENYQNQIGLFALLTGALAVPLSFLSIEILPDITVGGIVLIPLVFGVIFFLWKWIL